jgi:GTPase SAR1 family protein
MLLERVLAELTPAFIKENLQLVLFFGVLTYVLFLVNWIVTTDWESKFHCFSAVICVSGLFFLHYSHASLLFQYEVLFINLWGALLFYHYSTWKNNYDKVAAELQKTPLTASLRPFQGSIFRYLVTVPTTKNASNQWNSPPFRNAIHVLMISGYLTLLALHVVPFFTPVACLNAASPLCCRYNYAMEGFDSHEVNPNFCSGRVRIAFTGSWSTGKTYLINALLGHNYSTAQSSPAPSTDKFVCLSLGAPYDDPIRSDDFERRRHCEIMSHINDVTLKTCGSTLPNVVDVADTNKEFGDDFVFLDTPGFQREYGEECTYRTFYSQLIDKADFVYVVWDVSHGKLENEFAEMFRNKARGSHYELIYNRYTTDSVDMAFLNQQYAKMSNGQEILSQMYTMKLHENNTKFATEFQNDVLLLRAKIKSVNQTVHDNRKKLMKENLLSHRDQITGILSLRKLKLANRLIHEDLNLHVSAEDVSSTRSWD